MTKTDGNYSDAYREEAQELLADLEIALLELEESPDDMDLVGRVFRSMHTIKGSGAMFGFDDIAHFTHEIETVFDLVRSGQMRVSSHLISLTLKGRDQIKRMLDPAPGDEAQLEIDAGEIVQAFKKLLEKDDEEACAPGSPGAGKIPDGPGEAPGTSADPESANLTYRIRFIPGADLFRVGSNPLRILSELKELGECRVIAQLDRIPSLEELDAESCYAYFDVILTTDKGVDVIRDVFIFIEDSAEIHIDVIDNRGFDSDTEYKKLGQILIEKGDISEKDLDNVLRDKKMIGEMLVEKGLVSPDKVMSALAEQNQVKMTRQAGQDKGSATSIRVPAEKLDILVNLVGELVTVQARLTQIASGTEDNEFISVAEEIERLTSELRDNTLNIRMLPIGTTFGRFKRLVRDLSQELGKEIELMTEGAETELDKTVIEKLNDPLVHIIRNSIDHGIETPADRQATGKDRAGTIKLSAIHSGASVLITIVDDGKGLDTQAIRSKAIERGLIAPNAEMTDKELFGLIFMPGFSTASKVTNVSGRGVGMDVVKRSIDSLRGTIEVESTPGKGTSVTVRLPLTLAIIEGLLVGVGDDRYILPLSIVEECVELTREDVRRSNGRNMAPIRGELVPYIRLRKEFEINGELPEIEQIVVTGVNGSRVGFVVDNVIGEHQTVIKNLGKIYKDVEGISGATILGDGNVALIVDAGKIIQGVEIEEARRMVQ